MLPCEMARYITGFWREARKYGRFRGRKAGKRGLKPANPGAGSNLSERAVVLNPDLTVAQSGYNLAKMPFAIVLGPEAVEDLKRLKAHDRAAIRAALETHLRHEPKKVSRSRIKRLRGLRQPQYRLRVGEVRVLYDVTETTVEILAIVAKLEADSWLERFAKPA